jgi:uncharacterized membrane protein YtjA (UPF0391 family)
MSISAVLASISVALRNFAFSALIQSGVRDITIGDKSYEDILGKSGVIATATGVVFIVNTFLALFVALQCVTSVQSETYPIYLLAPLFCVGMTLFLICLIYGHLNFNIPKRAKTEKAE